MGVLWNFFLTSLLLTNAVCILHEKRFLKPCTLRLSASVRCDLALCAARAALLRHPSRIER